jgi:hypothetical protein
MGPAGTKKSGDLTLRISVRLNIGPTRKTLVIDKGFYLGFAGGAV